jgi:cytidylate kinase
MPCRWPTLIGATGGSQAREVGVTQSPPASSAATAPLVVTVSAAYGAGGSVIAPMLADRLGVAWLDRIVSAETASQVGRAAPVEEGLSDREEAATPGSRLFLYLARAAGVNALAPPEALVDHNELLRTQAEDEVRELCRAGGVLLGRAGAVVLAQRPATYHVRLDGPLERRVVRACAIEGLDEATARRRLADTDRARTLYVRRLYRADATDPALYHLVLDSTVLRAEQTVDVIVTAVTAFLQAGERAPAGQA